MAKKVKKYALGGMTQPSANKPPLGMAGGKNALTIAPPGRRPSTGVGKPIAGKPATPPPGAGDFRKQFEGIAKILQGQPRVAPQPQPRVPQPRAGFGAAMSGLLGLGRLAGGKNPIPQNRMELAKSGLQVPRPAMKKGGAVKSSASKRADGIAAKGKTRGKVI